MTDQPIAGWYPDPHNPSGKRYWDGNAWTDQAQPGSGEPPRPAARRSNTGLVIGIAVGTLLILGIIIAAIFAIAATMGDEGDDVSAPISSPVVDEDPEAPGSTDVQQGGAGTAFVGAGSHVVELPENWIVAPEDELMRSTFEGLFGDVLEYNGMWAENEDPNSGRVIVQSIAVAGTEEAMQGGVDGAHGNLVATSESVEEGEEIWRPTAQGLPAMSQSFIVEQLGQTLVTTVVQVDLGERTLQMTLMGDQSVEEIEAIGWTLADSVVPTA